MTDREDIADHERIFVESPVDMGDHCLELCCEPVLLLRIASQILRKLAHVARIQAPCEELFACIVIVHGTLGNAGRSCNFLDRCFGDALLYE